MLDRLKVAALLRETLGPDVPADAVERAASRIASLGEEWEEVPLNFDRMGPVSSAQCEDICVLGDWFARGVPLRIFRKKN